MPAPRFHPFTRLFFCALGIIGIQIGLELLLVLMSALSSPWTGAAPGSQLHDLETRFALQIAVLSYPPSLAWIYWCRTRFDGRSMLSLGLRPRRALPDWMRGALVGTLSIALLTAVLALTGAVSLAGWSSQALEMGVARSLLWLLGWAVLFFAVGFFEETLFRGYVLHNAFQWLGWRGAVLLQTAIFALVHLGNTHTSEELFAALRALPSLALIAVFFALCYRKTGSLWFPIGFHFSWNFCLGCVFSLPVSGIPTFHLLEVSQSSPQWLSGGPFGAEGSPLLIPILLALIFYISRAPDHPQAVLDLELMHRDETVAVPAVAMPEIEPVDDEPARENRYGTKFGTSQGFSADTLRELRDLQEARERQQTEAREAAKREAVARREIAAPTAPALEPLDIAPVAAAKEPVVAVVATATPIPTPPTPAEPPKNEPVRVETPPVEPAKKKPSAPRW